jgi:5-amino-6-(5-phospho-D-ribitylamino)uracil phosphatase
MPGTLYVTDLDGTLLGPDRLLSATSAALLRGAIDRGALVTCATARSWTSAVRLLGDFRFALPMVLHDGVFTYDAASDTLLDSHALPANAVLDTLRLFRERGSAPLVYGIAEAQERVWWLPALDSAIIRRAWPIRDTDPRNTPCAEWDDLPREGIFNVVTLGPREPMEELTADLRARVGDAGTLEVQGDTYHPDDFWVSLGPREVDKGTAVTALAERLDADRIVAIGDNLNDLPMFAVADESYAMAHATSRVREAATATLDDAPDAVARWIAANATDAAAP